MLPIKGPGWAPCKPGKISGGLPQPPGWWTQPGQPVCRPAHILLPSVLPASQEALLPSWASTRVLLAQTGQSGCHAHSWRLTRPPAHTRSTRAHTHMHKSAAAHAWAARRTQGHTCSQACTHGHVFTQALVLTHTDPDLCRSDTGRPVLILREPRLPHLKDSDKSVF